MMSLKIFYLEASTRSSSKAACIDLSHLTPLYILAFYSNKRSNWKLCVGHHEKHFRNVSTWKKLS